MTDRTILTLPNIKASTVPPRPCIHSGQHHVYYHGKCARLSPKQFRIFEILWRNWCCVVPANELGLGGAASRYMVQDSIRWLRIKLRPIDILIVNDPHYGHAAIAKGYSLRRLP